MLTMAPGEKMVASKVEIGGTPNPYLNSDTPVYAYDPKTWGPAEVVKQLKPEGDGINL
jgi:hypothetical protein